MNGKNSLFDVVPMRKNYLFLKKIVCLSWELKKNDHEEKPYPPPPYQMVCPLNKVLLRIIMVYL